jgi:hypothetical protein
MDKSELIAKMRGRVAMCRGLATSVADPRTAEALRQIADEGEADIQRLLQESEENPNSNIIRPIPRA